MYTNKTKFPTVVHIRVDMQVDHIMIDGLTFSNGLDIPKFRVPNIDSNHYIIAAKKLHQQRTAEAFPDKLCSISTVVVDCGQTFTVPYILLRKLSQKHQ